jgi:dCTP diphosphatase
MAANTALQHLLKFQNDRNWKQFNTPQNIAKSLVLEAAEVLEIFQWKEKIDENGNK